MYKRLFLFFTLLFLTNLYITSSLTAQLRAYPIDDGHSSITFSTHFSKFIEVPGSFGAFSGHVFYDGEDLSQLSTSVIIAANSINTNVKFRDQHLKRADFFDVENFPYISFTSSKVVKKGEQHFLQGEIELKGKKKNLEIPFQLIQNISPDPWGNKRFTLAGTLKVDRNDFGIGEEGEFFHRSIADTVSIQLLMSMAIRNTDRYSMFKAPFAKAIYERMTEKSVKEGLAYYSEYKEKEEAKFVHTAQFLDTFAQRLIQYKELDKAIKVYQYNNELFPDEDFTYSNLAHAFFLKGKKEKALSYSQKALEKNQQNTLAIELRHFLAN